MPNGHRNPIADGLRQYSYLLYCKIPYAVKNAVCVFIKWHHELLHYVLYALSNVFFSFHVTGHRNRSVEWRQKSRVSLHDDFAVIFAVF